MTHTQTSTALPTPAIAEGVTPTTHTEATTNIIDVQAMPQDTKEQVAAKWLAAKQIESAGESAAEIRKALGNRLNSEFGMQKDDRITINGASYKFCTRNGASPGSLNTAIDHVKARYEKTPWVGKALDEAKEAVKVTYTSYSLRLG